MSETSKPRRHRRFQFRLRTLLIAMTLLATAMAWLGWQVRIVRHRQAILAMIRERNHGMAWMPVIEGDPVYNRPTVPWYRTLLGDEPQDMIMISGRAFSADEIRRIREAFPESEVDVNLDQMMTRFIEQKRSLLQKLLPPPSKVN